MKEQLVEMTGLSPRVIRVWFQNKRCKDKKRTIQMKLQMQQEKVSDKSDDDERRHSFKRRKNVARQLNPLA